MRLVAIVALLAFAGPASTEDRSPASLLGGIRVAMAVMDRCNIQLGAETDRRLVATAEKLQAAAGMSDDEIRRQMAGLSKYVTSGSCDAARGSIRGVVDDLIRQAEARRGP